MAKASWNWIRSGPPDKSPLEGKLDTESFVGPDSKALEPMMFCRWRFFWAFSGGNMTDQGTHLMDGTQWFTDAGTPRSAVCHGSVVNMTGSEAPEVFATSFEYEDLLATWAKSPEPLKTFPDRLPTLPHVRKLLECMKTLEEPNAPVEIGHTAVCGPHLANIAMNTKRTTSLNPEAAEVY